MGAKEITITSLGFCFLLLIIPLLISFKLKLKLTKSILLSVFRMGIQLFLAGLYLKYLFQFNNSFLNLLWFLIMVLAASLSVIKNSDLVLKKFITPVFISLIFTNLFIILYFNYFVINLQNLFEAKYLVVIGGMLLGNSMRGNIIGTNNFYNSIKSNEKRYLYHLSQGASQFEALLPYIRKSLIASFSPTIATMMTVGIVSLPGMMTGQMLGGSSPMLAIKYQIAIMVAIFASTTASVTSIIFITFKTSFDSYGVIRKTIFKHT